MKLLVAVVEPRRLDELLTVFRQAQLTGFSVIPGVLGAGESGSHLGTRAYPGENVMVLSLVEAEKLPVLRAELNRFESGLRPGEAFKVMSLDAEAIV